MYITYISGLRTGSSVLIKGKESKLPSNWSEHWKTRSQAFHATEAKETFDLGNGYSVNVLVLRSKAVSQPLDVARAMSKDICRIANDGTSAAVALRSIGIASIVVSEKKPDLEELASRIGLGILKDGAALPADFSGISVSSFITGQNSDLGSTSAVCDSTFADVTVGIYALIDNAMDLDQYGVFEETAELADNDADFEEEEQNSDLTLSEHEEDLDEDEDEEKVDVEDEEDLYEESEDDAQYTEVNDDEYEDQVDELTLIQVKREPRLIFLMESCENLSGAELAELADYKGFDLALPLRKAIKRKGFKEGYLRSPISSIVSGIAGMGRDIQTLSSQHAEVVEQIDLALRNTVNQLLDYALYQQNQLLDEDQDPTVNGIVLGDFAESEEEVSEKSELPLVDYVSGGVFFTEQYANVVVRCVFPALFIGTTPAKQARLLHVVHNMIQNMAAEQGVKALVGVNYSSVDLLPTSGVQFDMLQPVANEDEQALGVATFSAWDFVNSIDGVSASPEGYDQVSVQDIGSEDNAAVSLLFGDNGYDMLSFVVAVSPVEEEEE